MNDFTKEELEEIVEVMRHVRKQGIETSHDISYEVEKKAIDMVESYCDHQSIVKISDADYVLVCANCGAHAGWE